MRITPEGRRRRPWWLILIPAALAVFPFITPRPAVAAELAQGAAAADPADEAGRPAPPTDLTIEEEIVVSALRLERPLRQVGSAVTVITRDEIERRGETTLVELLRTVPGVEVAQGGGPGKAASVFVRGGNSAHTLVLLDGVRVNSTTVGAFDFADLTTDQVERIEILRGPQSTLYGSEAIGGVVSITTRGGARGLEVEAAAEAGSHRHRRGRLGVGGGRGGLDYRLTFADTATDGVSAASERQGNREDDPYDATTAAGRFGLAFGGDGRADLALRYTESDTAIDGFAFGVGPVDDPDRFQGRTATHASLGVAGSLGRRWRQSLRLGLADERLTGRDPGDVFSNFVIDSRALELAAQSDLTVSDGDTLSFGVAIEERQGANRGSFDESVSLRSLYVQNHFSTPGETLHLTAGVRHDDHSAEGGETTYRLATSVTPGAAATRLHASFGTGFRAPSLNELFFPFVGNPALAAETSRGLDLGVERRFAGGRGRADLTGFDNDFDDLIVFDFDTFTFANVAAAEARGLELALSFTPRPGVTLAAAHTYTRSEDRATGEPLPRRPRHKSALTVDLAPAGPLSASLALTVVRDRVDSDGSAMDDYERLDLALGYTWPSGLRATLRGHNLLDQGYEEINGFTSPGIAGILGLAYRWAAPGSAP